MPKDNKKLIAKQLKKANKSLSFKLVYKITNQLKKLSKVTDMKQKAKYYIILKQHLETQLEH